MDEIVRAAFLALAGVGFVSCAALLIRLLTGDKVGYERNRRRTGGFLRNIRGELPAIADGTRDSRVSAGVAVNTRSNEWAPQGKLSYEAVSNTLRRPH